MPFVAVFVPPLVLLVTGAVSGGHLGISLGLVMLVSQASQVSSVAIAAEHCRMLSGAAGEAVRLFVAFDIATRPIMVQ